jgi:predicted phage terminase large subunit-like protein
MSVTLPPYPLRDLIRVVVAVDPSGTDGADDGDEIGIIVAGKGADGNAYVLADRSCRLSPQQWAKRAVDAYREFSADRIVAEKNFGGAMVESVLRAVDKTVPVKMVTASRGKIARAEPVAALYEQKRVFHARPFPELEDQLCALVPEGYVGEGLPDRADALTWAITELMITQPAPIARIGTYSVR